ncbi:hypothetical protein N7451_011690 [Penicillium sp. IBT 35674x]|nr:hypothetical protein N7451_011690 [Penicillium sp. IBT 35674x]
MEGRDNMQLPPPDSDLWQKAKNYLELPERDSTGPVKVPDDWPEGEGLDLLHDNHGFPPFQNTGSIATPQGRLITFPNLLQHRVEPFKLADPSSPGHYRSIKLCLIDPHYRIFSTRNVPPQQHHWWAQEVEETLAMSGLPRELSDEVFQETGYWPMGIEEARQHLRELMKELRWNATTRLSSMSGPGF